MAVIDVSLLPLQPCFCCLQQQSTPTDPSAATGLRHSLRDFRNGNIPWLLGCSCGLTFCFSAISLMPFLVSSYKGGTQSSIGSIPDSTAIAPITGRKVAVVARLLVISVKKTTNAAAPKITTATPRAAKGANPSPIHRATPEL